MRGVKILQCGEENRPKRTNIIIKGFHETFFNEKVRIKRLKGSKYSKKKKKRGTKMKLLKHSDI
jgi:hypothetical protein